MWGTNDTHKGDAEVGEAVHMWGFRDMALSVLAVLY